MSEDDPSQTVADLIAELGATRAMLLALTAALIGEGFIDRRLLDAWASLGGAQLGPPRFHASILGGARAISAMIAAGDAEAAPVEPRPKPHLVSTRPRE